MATKEQHDDSYYLYNKGGMKEDFEKWTEEYIILERKNKKVQIINQINAAQTKHEVEVAVS